ncbi:MAG: GC-type dockerin domain-anchored protein [Phycisphaerales bacterium]
MVPPNPPTATNLGTLVANTQLNGAATVTAAGQTKWFRFTLNDEISSFVNMGLELDTEGSTTVDGTGALNTSIGLYTSGGDLVVFDAFDGTQSLGMLTFGIDNHPAPGDGQTYNGRDGGVAPGDYFVAVTAGDSVIYQPGIFSVNNTSTQTGAVALHIRLMDPGAVTPPFLDAGEIAGGTGGAEHSSVHTVTLTGPNQVKWIRFTTATDTSADAGYFLDIFTAADAGDVDTEIGLYTADGFVIMSDDDDGVGFKSFLSFGSGGGPTTGDVGDGGAPTISDGRDSQLNAGEYLLAVASYNAAFGFQNWNVTTNGADLGPVPVHFSTNLPSSGSPCGPADIGVAGGLPGSDGRLDNNDFIAFISYFFAHNPAADMGVAGGLPGSDNAWDNNDFIAFISAFFAGPPTCR